MDFLEWVFFYNSVEKWLIAVVVSLVTLLFLEVSKKIFVRKFTPFAEKTETQLDDLVLEVVKKTKFLCLVVVSLYVGSNFLSFPEVASRIIHSFAIIVILLQGALWGNQAIAFWITRTIDRQTGEDGASVSTWSLIGFVGRMVLWSLFVLLILDNLGFDITSLIAGLGIGGVAVALASQQILGDLFASLTIVLDKPFVHGDFIIVGDFLGTVEHIGLKTTRVRSLSGEQVIFSNSDLLKSRIRNYKRMFERRVPFEIGVTYQTPHDKLELIPQIIKEAITSQEHTRFDRSHFKSYGDSALNYESVYYVLVPDYNVFMDIQQSINLTLYKRFAEEGIEFAYPTQTVFVENQ